MHERKATGQRVRYNMVRIDWELYLQDRIWFGYGWIGSVSGWRRLYLKPGMYWRVIDGRRFDIETDDIDAEVKRLQNLGATR